MICLITGLIISCLTGKNNHPVPKKFLSPIIYPFLSKDRKEDDLKYKHLENARKALSVDDEQDDEEKLKARLRKASYISEKFDD